MPRTIPYEMPLKVRRGNADDPTSWSVKVGDVELANVLATDGLKIEFEFQEHYNEPQPVVTLKFAPGALEPDFDIPLLEQLLEQKRGEVA